MIIRPVRAESFHDETRTDMTTLIVAFSYFANAPKDYIFPPENSYFVLCTFILLKG
jgi:hypothetical protein